MTLVKMFARAAFGLLTTLAGASNSYGQAKDFLSPAQSVRVIMDGTPWQAHTADGKDFKITLNKDGTGAINGPMPMPMALPFTWDVKGENVCLNVGPTGTKCIRFKQVVGGFEGWVGSTLDIKLSR